MEIDGKYVSAKPVHNTLVMNMGNQLATISKNRIKATRHRVLDIGVERFSSPFFFYPKYSALLGEGLLQSERVQCEDKEYDERMIKEGKGEENLDTFANILVKKLTGEFGEWKGFKIPEHLLQKGNELEHRL